MAQFVNVRTMHKTDPQGMISQCHRCSSVFVSMLVVDCYLLVIFVLSSPPLFPYLTCHRLLATPDIEAAVRVGDVYALLTEWHFSTREFDHALKMIQGMQKRY